MTIAQHTYSATLVTASDSYSLGAVTGSVTMDEGWSPHVRASINIPTPSDPVRSLLDPREKARVVLRAAVDYGDWNDGEQTNTWRTFDLSLRDRSIDFVPGTTRLELRSDESLLQDDLLVSSSPNRQAVALRGSLRTIISVVILSRIGAQLDPASTDYSFRNADPDSLTWYPGVSAWDFIDDLLQTAGLRLFCDDERRWRLVSSSFVVPELLAITVRQNVTGATESISRGSEDWFDAVLYHYSWTDSFGNAREAYDIATTPGYNKPKRFEINRAYPGPGAAKYVLDRAAGKGRQLELRALSDYSTQPTRMITATLPGIPIQTGLITSVTWDFDTDEMSVATRSLTDTPPEAWILIPAGHSWNDIPEGMSWNEYTNP
jgi:hypothetical protein